jgi:hypothetical protein
VRAVERMDVAAARTRRPAQRLHGAAHLEGELAESARAMRRPRCGPSRARRHSVP